MANAIKGKRRVVTRAAEYKTETKVIRTKVRDAQQEIQHYVRMILSMEEAEALRVVLMRIGGDAEKSRRGLIAAVNDALNKAGVKWAIGDSDDLSPRYRSLCFEDRHDIHIPDDDD